MMTQSAPNIKNDPVNHPSHYTSGQYQVINIITDQLGLEGLRGFCLGNCIKYISRAGKKDSSKTIQDLEKGQWYLNHYIKTLKENKVEEGDKNNG